jgi:predicted nucleotidyltransferase
MWNQWFKRRVPPEEDLAWLGRRLQAAYGGRLQSMILFGSFVAGEFHEERSDLNVLVVMDDWSFSSLREAADVLSAWSSRNPTPPVLLQADELALYARALPIEFSDMKEHYRVLYGDDLLAPLHVEKINMRHQCEQELALKLLTLRRRVPHLNGKLEPFRRLMVESLPSILTLLRAALSLTEPVEKISKLEAAQRFAGKIGADPAVLTRIHAMRLRRETDRLEDLLQRYLELVEKALRHVGEGSTVS